jgi:hypothetical protein
LSPLAFAVRQQGGVFRPGGLSKPWKSPSEDDVVMLNTKNTRPGLTAGTFVLLARLELGTIFFRHRAKLLLLRFWPASIVPRVISSGRFRGPGLANVRGFFKP